MLEFPPVGTPVRVRSLSGMHPEDRKFGDVPEPRTGVVVVRGCDPRTSEEILPWSNRGYVRCGHALHGYHAESLIIEERDLEPWEERAVQEEAELEASWGADG